VPLNVAQAPPAAAHHNGLGIAALCCGLVGVGLGLIPLMFVASGILGILAIIFGIIGFGRVRRHEATNKASSLIGLIAGVVALALAIWGIVIVVSATNQLSKDLSNISTSSTASQTAFTANQHKADYQEHELIHQSVFIGNS
jgi:nitrate reductase gamma subunit